MTPTAPAAALADETTLVITRAVAATPEEVFDAWVTREQFAAWIGPEGMNCQVPVLEARVGGRYEITMHLSNGQVVPVTGTFRAVERPHRIVFTWGWAGDPLRQSLITLTLTTRGTGTELLLRQEGLGTMQNRDDHGKGWTSTLNKLDRYLAR